MFKNNAHSHKEDKPKKKRKRTRKDRRKERLMSRIDMCQESVPLSKDLRDFLRGLGVTTKYFGLGHNTRL